jgi:hypothetical protein
MPKYNNHLNKNNGNEFLKVPPKAKDHESIFFYNNIEHLDFIDSEPYYNPVLFKEYRIFTGGETFTFEFPFEIIGQNSFLFIRTNTDSKSLASINLYFNNINNLPSLPLKNNTFYINNNHRIKRIIFVIDANCTGDLLVMMTDKFVPTTATIEHDYKP